MSPIGVSVVLRGTRLAGFVEATRTAETVALLSATPKPPPFTWWLTGPIAAAEPTS